eukprot:1001677-Lingulodinium_polyedra.AAC.1
MAPRARHLKGENRAPRRDMYPHPITREPDPMVFPERDTAFRRRLRGDMIRRPRAQLGTRLQTLKRM